MTERIAYNEYAKIKYNTIITMKICQSVQDSRHDIVSKKNNPCLTFLKKGLIVNSNVTIMTIRPNSYSLLLVYQKRPKLCRAAPRFNCHRVA